MTEEHAKRLFVVTVYALRTQESGAPDTGMQSVLVFSLGNPDIPNVWLNHAREVYPEVAGWTEHKALWIEIEQGTMVGPFRLNWTVENIATEVEQ